jgi:hypothetical protein
VPSLAALPAGVSLMEFSEAPLSSMLLSVGLEGRGLWGSLGNAVRLAATVSGDGEQVCVADRCRRHSFYQTLSQYREQNSGFMDTLRSLLVYAQLRPIHDG